MNQEEIQFDMRGEMPLHSLSTVSNWWDSDVLLLHRVVMCHREEVCRVAAVGIS